MDFTGMTDAQLLDYFRKGAAASCGRFYAEQLDRVIKTVEVPKSPLWARIAAGLLLALGLSKEASAQSVNQKEVTEQLASDHQKEATPTDSTGKSEIYGTLFDEKGQPIVNANVTATNSTTVIGHDLTDFDGNYSIKVPGAGRYHIQFVYLGQMITVSDIVPKDSKTKVCGTISVKSYDISESIRVGGISIYRPPIIDAEYPGGHILHSSDMLPRGW